MPKFSKERKAEIDAAVKKAVLDAVLRLLQKNHSSRFTIATLAEEAGVSKGTLYNYFANKDEIVAYAIARLFAPVDEMHERISASDAGVLDKLQAIVAANRGHDRAMLDSMVTMSQNISGAESSLPVSVLTTLRNRSITRMRVLLGQAAREGVFRELDMRYLMAAFFGFLKGATLYRRKQTQARKRTIEMDVEWVMDFCRNGVAAQRVPLPRGVLRDYSVKFGDGPKDRLVGALNSILRRCHVDRLFGDAISVSMIAREAGVTKSALYKHFKSKDEIFADAMRRLFESHERAKAECAASEMSVPEKLAGFAEAFMHRNRDTDRILFVSHHNESLTMLQDVVMKFDRHSDECLMSILEQGIAEGLFRDFEARELNLCFKGIMIVMVGYGEYHEIRPFVAKDAVMAVDIFLNGIGAHARRAEEGKN